MRGLVFNFTFSFFHITGWPCTATRRTRPEAEAFCRRRLSVAMNDVKPVPGAHWQIIDHKTRRQRRQDRSQLDHHRRSHRIADRHLGTAVATCCYQSKPSEPLP